MTQISPLKNWDFVGRSYDILRIDPLDIDAGANFRMVFDLQATDPVADQSALKPPEVLHIPDSGGSFDSNTKLIFSSYDLQSFLKIGVTFSISDPVDLFSFSLSSSYENTTQEIGSNEKVLTFTKMIVQRYKLQLDDAKPQKLDNYFQELVAGLPNTSETLIAQFGTHYARTVFYGGQAYQKLIFKKEDYTSMEETKINVKAEAKATFEVVKVGGGLETASNVSQEFRNKVENKHEQITYSGGTPSQNFDSWAASVKSDPAPIKLDVVPIYQLLSNNYFPADKDIEQKQETLKKKIDEYILNNGRNPSQSVIHYGDEVEFILVAQGRPRYLSYKEGIKYTVTEPHDEAVSGSHLPKYRFKIVPSNQNDLKKPVKAKDVVVLQSIASNNYLDAKSGGDKDYAIGEGLTLANQNNPQQDSAKWTIVQANQFDRQEVVDGDYLKLQTKWKNDDGEYGYLKGEPNFKESKQRVFSFGKGGRENGCYWQVVKV